MCEKTTGGWDYGWAIQSIETFANNKDVKFSHLTSTFLNAWIEYLGKTRRAKEMYPICIRLEKPLSFDPRGQSVTAPLKLFVFDPL